jgi:tetratricopeptide (TPR) repeat protein
MPTSNDGDRTLQGYIEAVLKLQRERSSFTEEELRQIALETGMSEEDLALARRRADDHLARGRGFLRYENWVGAIEELEQAVVLAPTSVDVLSTLATAYWRRNEGADDRERARAFAERALEIDPAHDPSLRLVSSIDKGERPSAATRPIEATAARRRALVVAVAAALVVAGMSLAVFSVRSAGGDDAATPTAPAAEAPTPPAAPAVVPATAPRPEAPKSSGFAALAQTIGREGIGPGMLTDARTIGVGADGAIVVGEYSDGRVQAFDASGAVTGSWNIGRNRYLKSIAVDRRGTIYLVYRGEIHRFDRDGKELGSLRYSGGPGFERIATTADGGLVATWNGYFRGGLLINPESRDAIVRFDRSGAVVRTMRHAVSEQTEGFETDVDVAEDGLGNLYALSSSSSAVLKFNSSGRFLNRFGGSGDAPGSLRNPEAIDVDGQGNVVVLDGRTIKRFDADGNYRDALELASLASDLAIADDGQILTVARTKVERYR